MFCDKVFNAPPEKYFLYKVSVLYSQFCFSYELGLAGRGNVVRQSYQRCHLLSTFCKRFLCCIFMSWGWQGGEMLCDKVINSPFRPHSDPTTGSICLTRCNNTVRAAYAKHTAVFVQLPFSHLE